MLTAENIEAAVRRGLSAPASARMTIKTAAGRYRRAIIDRGRTERHANDVRKQVRVCCHAAKIEWVEDLTEERVIAGIARLRRRKAGRDGNAKMTASTANHYRAAMRGFSRYLYRDRKLPEHRLDRMEEFRVGDKTRERRELSMDDVERLLAAAEDGRRIEGMHGPDRAWLYRVALATGYRRRELSSLKPEAFVFTAAGCSIRVAADFSKRRRAEKQPIPPVLSEPLRDWIEARPAGELLWPMTKAAGGSDKKTSKMIRLDLAAAGIAYKTDDGVADFHALRVAYCSWLARSGASTKALQSAARHSSIRLTMEVYTKIGRNEVEDAISKMPTPRLTR